MLNTYITVNIMLFKLITQIILCNQFSEIYSLTGNVVLICGGSLD